METATASSGKWRPARFSVISSSRRRCWKWCSAAISGRIASIRERLFDTWREFRAAFAAEVEAWEWALVDGIFSNLHRMGLMVRAGEPLDEGDVKVATSVLDAVPRAREVVIQHATTEKEREDVIEELSMAANRLGG